MARKFDKEGNEIKEVHVTLNEGRVNHKKLLDALDDGLLKNHSYAHTIRRLALKGLRLEQKGD